MRGSREGADAIQARPATAGFDPPPPADSHGYTFTAPGSFAVEVAA